MERRLDELGRINIPAEFRRVLGWTAGARIEAELKEGSIVFTKSDAYCSLCGGVSELKDVKGVRVCGSCVDEIKNGVFFDID